MTCAGGGRTGTCKRRFQVLKTEQFREFHISREAADDILNFAHRDRQLLLWRFSSPLGVFMCAAAHLRLGTF